MALTVDRPTMNQLLEVIRNEDITTKWYDLGLELNISNGVLKMIKLDHHLDAHACCCRMFDTWLERTPDANWEQLVTALNNIRLHTAADAVDKQYISGKAIIYNCIYPCLYVPCN